MRRRSDERLATEKDVSGDSRETDMIGDKSVKEGEE
jgi:hypothetical protein